MKRQKLLRALSTPRICIFCSCRLTGESLPIRSRAPLVPQCRGLATTNVASAQTAGTAATTVDQSGSDGIASLPKRAKPDEYVSQAQIEERLFLAEQEEAERSRRTERSPRTERSRRTNPKLVSRVGTRSSASQTPSGKHWSPSDNDRSKAVSASARTGKPNGRRETDGPQQHQRAQSRSEDPPLEASTARGGHVLDTADASAHHREVDTQRVGPVVVYKKGRRSSAPTSAIASVQNEFSAVSQTVTNDTSKYLRIRRDLPYRQRNGPEAVSRVQNESRPRRVAMPDQFVGKQESTDKTQDFSLWGVGQSERRPLEFDESLLPEMLQDVSAAAPPTDSGLEIDDRQQQPKDFAQVPARDNIMPRSSPAAPSHQSFRPSLFENESDARPAEDPDLPHPLHSKGKSQPSSPPAVRSHQGVEPGLFKPAISARPAEYPEPSQLLGPKGNSELSLPRAAPSRQGVEPSLSKNTLSARPAEYPEPSQLLGPKGNSELSLPPAVPSRRSSETSLFEQISKAQPTEHPEQSWLLDSKGDSRHHHLNTDARPARATYNPFMNEESAQSGHRATLFGRRELSSQDHAQAETQPDDWQHFRRHNTAPAPPQNAPAHTQPEASGQSEIERMFEKYRQERAQRTEPRQPASGFTKPHPPALEDLSVPRADQECYRCGQRGHIARDCERRACALCGQVGHTKLECPSSALSGPKSRPDDQQSTGSADDGEDIDFSERASRSRSFSNDLPPRRERPSGRGRRGEDGEDEYLFERRPRRGARNFEEDDEDDHRERRPRRSTRNLEDADEDDLDPRIEARRAAKKARKEQEARDKAEATDARKRGEATPVHLPEFISVSNLAQVLSLRYDSFVRSLRRLGYDDIFPGKILNSETSGMIAMEYGFDPIVETGAQEDDERDLQAQPEPDDTEYLPVRPPVVTIMGHVDHGKTTILDYLRKSSVAAGEAGGITQHIGAFSVPLAASGKTITFLDTPGHAAFLTMRQRGANVTDIVILVVAADDSVKPQTLEALQHARSASVPIVVAVNKIDKPEADLQRVKQDLSRHGLDSEDFGGDIQVIPVSGKTGQGIDELEDAVVTLSEVLDHRADTEGLVEGWVLEATTKKAGRVATVLVRRGTLRPGAVIVAGKTWGRVRTLHDEDGQAVQEATPGMPVEVDGWRDQPSAGDEVLQAESEQRATSVVEYRLEQDDRRKAADDMQAINEFRRSEQERRTRERIARQAGEHGEAPGPGESNEEQSSGQIVVPFIIKADVSGSAEAVSAYIMSVSSPLIAPLVLHSGVGQINESDVERASAAEGHIVNFNQPASEGLKGEAAARGVNVMEHNIIYRVLDDVKALLEDKLPPLVTQKVAGEAEVGAVFEIGLGGKKKLKIAGCKVRNGVVERGSRVRVMRGAEKLYDGTVSSLKNVKKDVEEMRKGSECGIGFSDWVAFETGDLVQTYKEIVEKRKL